MDAQPLVSRSTAALKCLFNDEIISEILNFQSQEASQEAERHGLLNIALVCRALEEPAMNELWRQLDSFTPLLRLLPSVKLIGNSYALCGPLDSAGWGRFDHYAGRVLYLDLIQPCMHLWLTTSTIAITVESSLYFHIAKERTGPFLPRLRSLTCSPLVPEAVLFLSQSLRSISFDTTISRLALTFLSAAWAKARTLRDLRITFEGTSDASLIIGMIASFRTISQLDLRLNSPLSHYLQVDRILAHRNGLKHYFISARDQWENDIQNRSLTAGFSDLESLTVEGGFNFLKAALARVESEKLSKLQLILRPIASSPVSELEWKPMVGFIHTRGWSSLHELFIDFHYTSLAISLTTLFESLDHFRSLRRFSIWRYWPITVSDADIEKIARNCPSLDEITLIAGKGEDIVAPSIACLVYLATHCPNLGGLEMSFKSAVSLPFKVPGSFQNNKVLKVVYIRGMLLSPDAQDKKTLAIARFIDRIFPWVYFVKNLTFADPAWAAVELLVKKFQVARAERELGR
ncbi:hypothetical protein C8F04DRAFT_1396453 [Mycena alexandri]|uniref:Uncharacterized protein n=1 Tax=Mycena alexandri TaxID=1745969 RepID=A0AAD6SRM9_9AGAR|nr:hypothetical protein C8F04DRAFT_1396453 [Mycena alexandri]